MTSIANRHKGLAGTTEVEPWVGIRGVLAFAALATAIALVLLSPNVLWPYHDGAIFGAIGDGLTRGAIPYRDLWDHKPPGIYLVAAAAALMPGGVWAAFWILSVVVISATALVLRSLVGTSIAILATACLALYPAAQGGGYTETFGALPAVTAVLCAARGRPVLAGVLAASAVCFSLQYIPMVGALFVLASPGRYALGVFGALTVSVAVIALFGALPGAWDALVAYSSSYLGSSAAQDPTWHLAVVLAPIGTAALFRGSWALTRVERMAVIWLIVGVLAIALQGRHLGHYATALIIPLAILAARAPRQARVAGFVVLAVALLATATVVRYPQVGPTTTRIGEWVRSNTESTESILVWGVEANVYLAAERPIAGRYPYLMPLVTPGYSTPGQVSDWVQQLQADPPAAIVDAEAAVPYWPEGEDFLRPPPPGAAGGRTLDILDPFRAWVAANYEFAHEIDGRKIYVLRD